MKIKRQGNYGIIDTGLNVYTFEIAAEDTTRSPATGTTPWPEASVKALPWKLGNFNIVPWGSANNLPIEIRELLDDEGITPESLNKQAQLLWGQGPALYQVKFENGQRQKIWGEDKNIQSWLNDWNAEDYLLKAVIEYRHMNGHFSKYFRNRGVRIGQEGRITHLEHVSSTDARLEWNDGKPPTHIITGDFARMNTHELRRYPVFNPADPFRRSVSMSYSNLYAFALDNEYSRPSFYGLRNWIKLGSNIPKLLNNFNVNAAAIRYHIKSPAIYWQQKKDQYKENCRLRGVEFREEDFEDYKDKVFEKFGEGLIGIEKAGKMMTSETIWDDMGQEYVGWSVETIDPKIRQYVQSQLDTAKRSAFEITAGIGLHPALSNISADGNLPSGSEQLYAFKLYLKTGVDIPESIVCRDINNAIKANFPNTKWKIGFYHDVLLTEEQTNPEDRTRNN